MTDGRKTRCFETDLQFCPDCGTVLPNPNKKDQNVACARCNFKIPISAFDGIEIHSTLTVNKPLGKASSTLTSEDAAGPTVDRTCSKCGHEGMTYSTRQTRSADEGQTVFFGCPNCKNQEIEYS
ncbi:DNA-directed RNA polymerase I subunit RPA12-like [Haliotis cracherodii]|uniref:DNA-directed RNA polymerase I subunit RPA12-like n=1 Tax=Haliotis rufescens TaxID=6454 RepID=UPI001EB08C38|nr:DNA-directed RNA polymerase I subunit RPA12-like [Haliotis rufescens]